MELLANAKYIKIIPRSGNEYKWDGFMLTQRGQTVCSKNYDLTVNSNATNTSINDTDDSSDDSLDVSDDGYSDDNTNSTNIDNEDNINIIAATSPPPLIATPHTNNVSTTAVTSNVNTTAATSNINNHAKINEIITESVNDAVTQICSVFLTTLLARQQHPKPIDGLLDILKSQPALLVNTTSHTATTSDTNDRHTTQSASATSSRHRDDEKKLRVRNQVTNEEFEIAADDEIRYIGCSLTEEVAWVCDSSFRNRFYCRFTEMILKWQQITKWESTSFPF